MKQYKRVQGFPNYLICSDGTVVSTARRRPAILKGYDNGKGYLQVQLMAGSRGNTYRKVMLIHRLVAEAFIANPDGLPIVNHIDHNTLNNDVSNLEWCDQSHNMRAAKKHNPRNRKITERMARMVFKLRKQGFSLKVIAKKIEPFCKGKISSNNVSHVLTGKTFPQLNMKYETKYQKAKKRPE